jgi:hypothetical protein
MVVNNPLVLTLQQTIRDTRLRLNLVAGGDGSGTRTLAVALPEVLIGSFRSDNNHV